MMRRIGERRMRRKIDAEPWGSLMSNTSEAMAATVPASSACLFEVIAAVPQWKIAKRVKIRRGLCHPRTAINCPRWQDEGFWPWIARLQVGHAGEEEAAE